MSEVDYADVQGLVRFGYGKMTGAVYALVQVRDAAAARAWLRAAPVTSAVEMQPPPATALNIAFTAPGLRALGVPESVVEGFSHEFRGGMAQESRARQIGDVGNNAQANWAWGSPGREPHAVVMFFAEPARFEAFVQDCTGNLWDEAFGKPQWLETEHQGDTEPFGFTDSISQPQMDWQQQRDPTAATAVYSNVVALGEFLLGYRNEYGKFTDRPLLDTNAGTDELSPAEDEPTKKDLGKNGTYLVMRHLDQDVRKFWQFLYEQAGGNFAEAETLGAQLVGRTRGGDPLARDQKELIAGLDPKVKPRNQFTFDQDTAGISCPFGAHIRRVNPRNTDFPEPPANLLAKLITMLGFGPGKFRDDSMSAVRFHRVIRRGREYGRKLLPEQAVAPAPADEAGRGLHFICLNANISRQFEFLQNAWVMNTKFSGLTGESDPLLGNREAIPGCPMTNGFSIPENDGTRRRVEGLPQFVTVRGGGYFFLPSIRALRYFANVGG